MPQNQVIDIFDTACIKKPKISILSEEFLSEIKGMKHQNLALELLKKILNDEIRSRSKTNLVRRTLNKYGYPPDKQQKAIDTVLKQAELLADYFVKGKDSI